METYDPTDDILNFRDFRSPWVRVESADRVLRGGTTKHVLDGEIVRPLAYNATQNLVLLYMPNSGWPLVVCRSESPDKGYGELLHYYENIWAFSGDK